MSDCTIRVTVKDCELIVEPKNTTAIVKVDNCAVSVILPSCTPQPAANPPQWYTLLNYYDTDEEAIGAGLAIGQIYKIRTTGGALGLKRGTIVEIEAI
jgi:hypothetical protein